MKVGIDAGGTLVKIAYARNAQIEYVKFPAAEMEIVAEWVNEQFPDACVCLTGGKSTRLQSLLQRDVRMMIEFEATYRGVLYLLEQMAIPKRPFVLTNVGTGTSIHFVNDKVHYRVGGTGVGGGTLVGLSHLLTGSHDYEQIVRLAHRGNREAVDLKVSHIYEGAKPPIPGDLTASNFGNVLRNPSAHQPQDLASSVIGLVGETVATTSVLAAAKCDTRTNIYIGSSFIDNELLKDVVKSYTMLRGSNPLFIPNGEFSGALGAQQSLYA